MASFAHVARMNQTSLEYMTTAKDGRTGWALASQDAEVFDTLRDATRAALRLPNRERAFALPVAWAPTPN